MKEIKFREAIFAEPDNRFVGFHHWGWIDGEWVEPESTDPEASKQYTGLKDKNGKEIYEGDIVRYETEDGDVWTAKVIWDTGDENVFISGFTVLPIQNVTDDIYNEDGEAPKGWTGEWEVIGNIYENPELLEVRR